MIMVGLTRVASPTIRTTYSFFDHFMARLNSKRLGHSKYLENFHLKTCVGVLFEIKIIT